MPAETAVAAVRTAAYRLRMPLRPIKAGAIAKLKGPAWPSGADRLGAAARFLVRALVVFFEGFAGALLAAGILLALINKDSRKVNRVPSMVAQRAHVVPSAHPRPSRGHAGFRPDYFGRP